VRLDLDEGPGEGRVPRRKAEAAGLVELPTLEGLVRQAVEDTGADIQHA
jgi:hypothetical protein